MGFEHVTAVVDMLISRLFWSSCGITKTWNYMDATGIG